MHRSVYVQQCKNNRRCNSAIKQRQPDSFSCRVIRSGEEATAVSFCSLIEDFSALLNENNSYKLIKQKIVSFGTPTRGRRTVKTRWEKIIPWTGPFVGDTNVTTQWMLKRMKESWMKTFSSYKKQDYARKIKISIRWSNFHIATVNTGMNIS